MKKSLKVLVILFFIAIVVGSVITVYLNNLKEEKKNKTLLSADVVNKYVVVRENNKYIIKDELNKIKSKQLKNIFYDDKNVYIYLDGEAGATILKYNVEKNKTYTIYDDNKDLSGEISRRGKFYVINNSIYDLNFKKVGDYPQISENEIISTNLKYKLVKTENTIFKKMLGDDNTASLIDDTEKEKYKPYLADGNTIILLGTSDDSEKLYFLNDNKANLLDVNYNKDNNYYLIDDGTYLVEADKDSYFVYDVINNAKVYSSNKDYSNYVFFKTKYMCSDKDGNTIFGDFLTGEVRTILESKKKSVRVDKFMSSSDNYSVVVLLDDNKNTFYIFYL